MTKKIWPRTFQIRLKPKDSCLSGVRKVIGFPTRSESVRKFCKFCQLPSSRRAWISEKVEKNISFTKIDKIQKILAFREFGKFGAISFWSLLEQLGVAQKAKFKHSTVLSFSFPSSIFTQKQIKWPRNSIDIVRLNINQTTTNFLYALFEQIL